MLQVIACIGAAVGGFFLGAAIMDTRHKRNVGLEELTLSAWERELALKEDRLKTLEQAIYAKDEEIHRTDRRPWKEEP